jgi:hypothetical protein
MYVCDIDTAGVRFLPAKSWGIIVKATYII